MEARAIVRQAMAILTPAVPARMEDGHQMLTHWTRKIIVEEGHTVPQLVHILHLIVQHFKVLLPVILCHCVIDTKMVNCSWIGKYYDPNYVA